MSDNNVNPPSTKPDFFNVFRKMAGDKTDPNVTKVGMDFGRFLGEAKQTGNKNVRSNAPKKLVNGQHNMVQTLRANYAKQGLKIPAKVEKLMSTLNNVALHGQQAAAMDPKVRLQMIAGGTKSLDFNVIQEQENGILTQLQELTGDVLFAEDRLDFRKKVADTNKAETLEDTALIENLNAKDKRQVQRANQVQDDFLSSLTYDEHRNMVANSQYPDGIKPGIAQIRLNARTKARAETEKAVIGLKNAKIDHKAKVLATSVPVELLEAMQAQSVQEFELNPAGLGSIALSGTNEFFTMQQIDDALTARLKLDAENNPLASELSRGLQAEAIGIATSILQSMDNGTIPPSSQAAEEALQMVEVITNSTDADEIKETSKLLAADMKALNQKQAELQPTAAAKLSFKSMVENRFIPADLAAASIVSRDPSAFTAALANNDLTREGNAFFQELQSYFSGKNSGDSDAATSAASGYLDSIGLGGSASDAAKKAMAEQLATATNPQVQSAIGNYMGTIIAEQMVVGVLHRELSTALDNVIEDTKAGLYDPEESGALTGSIVSFMEDLFGNDTEKPTEFSNVKTDSALIGLEDIQIINFDEAGNEEIEVPTDVDGEPLRGKTVHPDVLMEQLETFDTILADAGFKGDSISKTLMRRDGSSVAVEVAGRSTPTNLEQHEFIYANLDLFKQNPNSDPNAIMQQVATNTWQSLRRRLNFDETKAAENNIDNVLEKATQLDRSIFNNAWAQYGKDLVDQYTAEGLDRDQVQRRAQAEAGEVTTEQLFRKGYITKSQLIGAVTLTDQ